MKVRLLARKGNNKAGSVVEYDDGSARWLIQHGYAEEFKARKSDTKADEPAAESEDAPAAPRRGRPRKDS